MKSQKLAHEVNFDGIVGPTHSYSGLSYGNIASQQNQYSISNPREAALQGLKKMKSLADMGIYQAVLPPHERPHLPTLRALGFLGTGKDILTEVCRQAPDVLIAASSAAAMWTANAATFCPSADSADRRVHITTANLLSKFHRSIESAVTKRIFEKIFFDQNHFIHHAPLHGHPFADEGAANHTRFCQAHGLPGVHLFVFGRQAFHPNELRPKIFPARQTLEASQAIARLHKINPNQLVFAQQHPKAIDAGAFHNDVVSVGNCNVFFYHERAFVDKDRVIAEIQQKVANISHCDMTFFEVKNKEVSLKDAINTYMFNSQLISLPKGGMALIAPIECQENEGVRAYLENLLNQRNSPIKRLDYINLRQSMRNGGGPACLRIRTVLNSPELDATLPTVFLNDALYKKLTAWIKRHYRDYLQPKDLADPLLFDEVREALEDLTKILKLGPIYDFQR